MDTHDTRVKGLMTLGYTREEAEESITCDEVDAKQQGDRD